MTIRRDLVTVLFTLSMALICTQVDLLADNGRPPVKLIFDTDIGNDCDDVLALGMIHALQSRGECELLAVTITKDHELAAPFVDAVNTFYGRGSIPIGVCRSGVTPQQGKFNGLAIAETRGELRYPHDLVSGKDAPDAVQVLRATLAQADDNSIVIAQVGFSTNLANLLASKADELSELSGADLVQKKVRLLSIMAGAFTQIKNEQGQLYDHREYNIIKDIPAAKRLVADWPTEVVWSGFEIGKNLTYPHESIEQDYDYAEHHPLAEAYTLYNPPPHNRPTWDLTSVLYAVRAERNYFELSPVGNVQIADDGLTTFQHDANGKSRYLIISDEHKGRATEAMVMLASQPPRGN